MVVVSRRKRTKILCPNYSDNYYGYNDYGRGYHDDHDKNYYMIWECDNQGNNQWLLMMSGDNLCSWELW